MDSKLAPFCVYTIVLGSELQRIHAAGGKATITENKRWVRGEALFREAVAAGQRMPVVFADAATTADLIYFALLTDVTIQGGTVQGPTSYSFEGLTPIHPPVAKSALNKLSDGQPLDENYIRPYVLCHTPAFLQATSDKPKTWPEQVKAILPQRTAPSDKGVIYLFGYSGKTIEEIERAVGNDGRLIDIRYSPRSRRAGFSRAGLERVFGDRYHHVREFGNADYQSGGIRLADAEAGVQIIESLLAEHSGPLFLMCSCEDGATCHRREVGQLLQKRGHSVKEYDFG